MKVIDFNLGTHPKSGQPQWKFVETEGRSTTIYLVDRKSELQPKLGQTRFLTDDGEVVHKSDDGRFHMIAVHLRMAMPQLRSDEECIEVEPNRESEKAQLADRRIRETLAPHRAESPKKAKKHTHGGPAKGVNQQPPKHGGGGTSRDAKRRLRKRLRSKAS